MTRARTSIGRSAVGLAAAGALVTSALMAAPAVATPEVSPEQQTVAPAAFPPEELTFTAVLPYDRRGLLADARAISSPGKPRYRNFLTLQQAAAKFGATRKQREALRAVATELGMKVTFSATGLTARLTAPVDTWNDVYGQEATALPADPWVIFAYLNTEGNGLLPTPEPLASVVRMVVPEMTVLAPVTASARATEPRNQPLSTDDSPPLNLGTPFGPGEDCVAESVRPITYSPMQIHTPYGTKSLHERGMRGAGARIANIAGGYAFSEQGLQHAAECFDFRAPPVRFTGGPGIGPSPVSTSGDDEGDLDVQTIAAVVPQAERIDFIQLAQTLNEYMMFVEGVDLLVTRATPMPDVATMSFGACEPSLLGPGMSATRVVADDHFALAGVLGVTMLAASGDGGSSDCSQFQENPPLEGRLHAVQYPASSPWITGVGGTRLVLGEGNQRVEEVVWNDTPWTTAMGGTGGPSLGARPWYQKPVTAQDRRLVPDVAAHASTFAGWPLAFEIDGVLTVIPAAGTSAASPFTAANLALIAAAERKAGRGPLGFVSPTLYALAEKPEVYKSAFYDITKGSNQIYFEAACCVATKGYDQATGLGSITYDELIKVIPRPGRGR